MSAEAQIVKLCGFSHIRKVCDTSGASPVAINEVILVDSSSNVIPHDSIAFPAAGSGFVGDGSGFIRSYFTDMNGTPIAEPATWDCVSCNSAASTNVNLGYVNDPADPAFEPIPVQVITTTAPDGTVTTSYVSLVDGSVVTLAAGQVVEEDVDRFDTETQERCVRNAAGLIVASVTRVRVWDKRDVTDGVPSAEPVVDVLINDADGLEYVLGAGEVAGSCDVYLPVIKDGCLTDATTTPATLTPVCQMIPVIDGALSWADLSYVNPTDGAAIVPNATDTFRVGSCGTLCHTCP